MPSVKRERRLPDGAIVGRSRSKRSSQIVAFALILLLGVFHNQCVAEERPSLRVCAPPANLPMSNKLGEGYENKIAELLAQKLGLPLEYEWFPQRIGFIRNTLGFNDTPDGQYKCDLVIGVIENFEQAATTIPYLRSTWALVYVRGRGLDFIQSQDDLKDLPREKKSLLRIGVWDKGPAPEWFFHRGLMDYATPYQIMSGDAERNPGKIIEEDLVEDKINLTMVWGPIAGYYANTIKNHDIVVIPLRNELRIKFDFNISMGVRFGEPEWKERLNALIAENRSSIDSILEAYGVPRLELVDVAGNERK
ncbi:MAG: quinoprotein dehydrogenase-associated putative ABC transporter substrate-binding protein [Proteobacteria bacterium]|nr:quinoprotein dehydrogenase-associated putative ABC transporter substrate-binding protein [Pseudomonadota bacterium]